MRIEAQFADVSKVETIYLVFRNIGDEIAHDAHSLDTLNRDGALVEQPMDGRLMLAPGDEIAVRTRAMPQRRHSVP